MRVAFITDQHFGVRANSDIFLDNYRKFYSEIFFPELKKQGVEHVVGMGDFWENRVTVSWKTLQAAQEIFFDPMAEAGIRHTMIYGNHDVSYRNTNDVNGVDFLAKMYLGETGTH